MPEPKGWQVLEALAAVLAGMTGTRPWGGQYPSDPVVDHKFRSPRTSEDFLRIRVLEASGSTSRITNINAIDNVTHDFRVRIEALIIGNLEQPPQGWLQRVRDDLGRTVAANLSLGGLCSGFGDEITWEPTEDSETEFGQQLKLVMTVTLRFRESWVIA